MFTIKDAIECLRQERDWCKDNHSKDLSEEKMQGFEDGLNQAIYILNKLDKNEVIGGENFMTSTSHFLVLPRHNGNHFSK